ncbi:MAG: alkaline phosphatase family protein [Solirubrobacteraceae bacterium]|nr:alkaline phosphatase family protein [Patulibacter sp.]
MSLPSPHARPSLLPAAQCATCHSPLTSGQRYCVECGTRNGPLPYRVTTALQGPTASVWPVLAEPLEGSDDDLLDWADGLRVPAAWQAATAILGLLAFGVIAGSLGGPGGAYAAGGQRIAYVQQPAAPAAAAPVVAASTPAADTPAVDDTSTATDLSTPAVDDTSSDDGSDDSADATTPEATTPVASTNGLPPIKHVFVIVLSGHGADDAFGASSASTYLSTTLKSQGEYLSNYYAVAQSPLANGVALISGQGPTPETTANCPTYTDITPATPGDNGQVLGTGCVYPAATRTIGDQLSQDGETWKTYNEDIGAGGADAAKTCRHPAIGQPDADGAPKTGDGYVTWRNPFMYFHSVTDATTCAKTSVGLDQLVPDLATEATTPSLSYIVPSRSDDGSTTDVTPGETGGLAATDTFLRIVVPEIQNSAAYKDGGMIAITFDGAPQTGDGADTSSCCDTPTYPNLPTTPAATTPTDGAVATTPADGATTPTTPGATTPSATDAATTTGGGRVGLLLLSDYVKAGSTNLTSSYNHYSLLASIENLFSLDKLGYAAVPTLPAFDISIYNGKKY